MSHRYEAGVRLLRAGQVDEAIQELQAARGDPRLRWQALTQLGHCFKARTTGASLSETLRKRLRLSPTAEAAKKKEVLFLSARAAPKRAICARRGCRQRLANIDFSYRDIGRMLDEWQTRLDGAKAPK